MDIVKRLIDVFEASRAPIAKEAADEIERLNLELQKRDKCSFMGPMRDCPTHGESKDAARYRWLKRQPWVKTKGIHAWGALLDDAIDEARNDAPDETPNALAQGPGGSSPGPAGAMGCATRGED